MATVQIIEDTQAQWQQGTLVRVQATPDGDLILIDSYTTPALSLDGVDDNLQVTSFGDGNLSNAAGTFYVRVRRADAVGLGTAEYQNLIMIKTQDVSNGRKIGVGLDGSGRAKIYKFDGNHGAWSGTTVITDNRWHHLALVSDGAGNLKLYVDGALEISQTITPFAIGAGRLVWAAYYDAGLAYYAKVDIDEPAVWNVARSQAEIQADMPGELQGNESGLVGLWKLNEGTGTTATDATSYARNGTIAGATWITRTVDVTSGNRISPTYGLSPLIQASGSVIQWSSTEPTSTSITVETRLSTDGGAIWGAWQQAANGGSIPGITSGLDLANVVLQIRETLQRDTPTGTSPALHSLTAEVQGAAAGSSDLTSSGGVRPTGWLQGRYTVIPVGLSDLSSLGMAREHIELPSGGGVPPTGWLQGRYTVVGRPIVTVVLSPIRDAFVWDKEPTLNYGDVQDLAVGRSGGHLVRGLLQFDLSTLRTDLLIVSALLRLRCRFVGSGEMGVYPLLGGWDELGVTWTNQPPVSPTAVATSPAPSEVGTASDFDITGLFLGWYQSTRTNYGVGLRVTDENTMTATLFGTKEAGANWQPQLLVTYYEPEAIPDQSNLPTQGTVRLPGLNHLLGTGEVASLKQASQCMSWVTGWYGYYTDLLGQPFAQGWNLPVLCELIRQPGSELCNSMVLTTRDFTREIWISDTTRVLVYVVWVTSVDLRDASNPYLTDPRYCYCKARDTDVQVPVFTAFADVQDLVGGTCWVASGGVVNRREVLSAGFALQVSNLPTSGFIKGLERSDLTAAGAVSRKDAPSSGIPRLAATSDLTSTGSPRVPAWADLASTGTADIGPNSLPATGTVLDRSDLASTGTPTNTADTLPASGRVADRSDVPSTGQTGLTPDQLPSTGSPRVPGWNDVPTKAHATGPWMASVGVVHQHANLYSAGNVRVHVSLPSSGFIHHRGLAELPSEGWPRVRDASDLPSTAMTKAAHSDIGSQGIVTAIVLEIDIDLRAWPPEGRNTFPPG